MAMDRVVVRCGQQTRKLRLGLSALRSKKRPNGIKWRILLLYMIAPNRVREIQSFSRPLADEDFSSL